MRSLPCSTGETQPLRMLAPADPRDQPALAPLVADEYPVTEESIRHAIDACNAERAAARQLGLRNLPDVPYPDPRDHQLRQLQAINALHTLMDFWGTDRVELWAQNAAAMRRQQAAALRQKLAGQS